MSRLMLLPDADESAPLAPDSDSQNDLREQFLRLEVDDLPPFSETTTLGVLESTTACR